MDSMPQTTDEQARNDVTTRVTARVAAGWPRLGQPEVRFRGRYCYVAVTLPDHRAPTPLLCLRWTGSPDEWAIAGGSTREPEQTSGSLPRTSIPSWQAG